MDEEGFPAIDFFDFVGWDAGLDVKDAVGVKDEG